MRAEIIVCSDFAFRSLITKCAFTVIHYGSTVESRRESIKEILEINLSTGTFPGAYEENLN